MSHIYAKLNVHSHQELINLVERQPQQRKKTRNAVQKLRLGSFWYSSALRFAAGGYLASPDSIFPAASSMHRSAFRQLGYPM
nr:hypothetical protein [Eggerthella sp. YY7918]